MTKNKSHENPVPVSPETSPVSTGGNSMLVSVVGKGTESSGVGSGVTLGIALGVETSSGGNGEPPPFASASNIIF